MVTGQNGVGRLAGKVAVITGGGRGIGGATSRAFAQEGARVVIGDIRQAEAEETISAIQAIDGEAVLVPTDVTREEDCARLMRQAETRFGRIDVLVTCAGIFRGGMVPVEEFDEFEFQAVLDVNLTGTFRAVKHAVPVMRRGGGGVVILIASGAGVRGPSGSLAYGASKGGVHGLALTLEARLAPYGIRVHDVCPGNIDTTLKREAEAEIRRRGRQGDAASRVASPAQLGDPAGVAALLTLLASDASGYLRGTLFTR